MPLVVAFVIVKVTFPALAVLRLSWMAVSDRFAVIGPGAPQADRMIRTLPSTLSNLLDRRIIVDMG